MTTYRVVGPGGNAAVIEAADVADLVLRDWTDKVACIISDCPDAFGYTLETHGDDGKVVVYPPDGRKSTTQ